MHFKQRIPCHASDSIFESDNILCATKFSDLKTLPSKTTVQEMLKNLTGASDVDFEVNATNTHLLISPKSDMESLITVAVCFCIISVLTIFLNISLAVCLVVKFINLRNNRLYLISILKASRALVNIFLYLVLCAVYTIAVHVAKSNIGYYYMLFSWVCRVNAAVQLSVMAVGYAVCMLVFQIFRDIKYLLAAGLLASFYSFCLIAYMFLFF